MIERIDPVNRLIYLDASSAASTLHPIDLYREMRQMREDDETIRGFDPFLVMKGSDKKNASGSKRTERYLVLLDGTRIVPFDTDQTLAIDGTIISDDGLEGPECFNTSSVSSTVNINYTPKQVEVIVVETGGSALTLEEHNKLMDIGDKLTDLDIVRAISFTDVP